MGKNAIIHNMTTTHKTDSEYVYADVFAQNLISDTEYAMLCNGFLPAWARNWITREFGGIPSRVRKELVSAAQETKYEPDTAIAIVFSTIAQHKSLRKWATANLKKSYQSITPAVKVDNKWLDAQFTVWPPYAKPDKRAGAINGTIHHVPARYVFKHKEIRVDLGVKQGDWNAVMHTNPNSAMQAVATRLGRRVNGDFNKVAQQIVGDDDLIVTSTTAKVGNQWVILLSMMRDPKKTISQFAVTEAGGVISGDVNNPASSISETEYALIKGGIEEGDEQSLHYGYEFDQGLQAQLMMEDMNDKLNADTMSPSMLTAMDIAAEMGDMMAFMSDSPVVRDEYLELVDVKIAKTIEELVGRYKINQPLASESAIRSKAIYVAHLMHEELVEAIEDAQRYVLNSQTQRDFFTMKGSITARARFFGVPSSYERVNMPAKNPSYDGYYLPVTEYVEPKGKTTEIDQRPSAFPVMPLRESFVGRHGTVCVNANGARATAPAKKPTALTTATMSTRLASIVSAIALTGDIKKSIGLTKKLRVG